jgi:16S rRNA (uracil1498-N3)-methyltransferase
MSGKIAVKASMHRFFLTKGTILGDEVIFPEEQAHQINRVLRLAVGEMVVVLDNLGSEYQVELTEASGRTARGLVCLRRAAGGEPLNRVWLYIALTQREKFELILQKCTEIGVTGFIPLISSRSMVQDGGEVERKRSRWERILAEAAEQGGRGRIPTLSPALPFVKAIKEAGQKAPMAFIFWENEQKLGLRQGLANALRQSSNSDQETVIMIGPEGGFSKEEAETACNGGMTAVSLGRRILRMETAAITATALILYEFGDMG